MFKLPDGSLRLIVQGLQRVTLNEILSTQPYLRGRVTAAVEGTDEADALEIDAFARNIKTNFQQVVSLSPLLSDDLQTLATNINEPGRLADFIASSLSTISTAVKQDVLETLDIRARMDNLNRILIKELEVLELGSKIQSQVQSEVGKNQRDYFLREQLKAIQKELGEGDDQTKEIEELAEKIEAAGMPEVVKKEALRELDRLSKMPVAAAEYTVSRTYLDWLVALPWNKRTDEVIDLPKTKTILDADHSGLEKAKDRILEYLAVRKLNPEVKGPILCFAGPPESVRHRSRNRLRPRSDGSSSACRSAACETKPKSAGIDGRTSARCPVRSFRGFAGRIRRTRCSSWTKSTSSVLTSAATLIGVARGAGSGTEQHVPRSLSRRAVRSQRGAVHHHGKRARSDSTAASRPHGSARDRRLHGRREAEDRDRSPRRQADQEPRVDARTDPFHVGRATLGDSRLHPRSRRQKPRAGNRSRFAARSRGDGPKAPPEGIGLIEITPDAVVEMLGAPKYMDEEIEERTKDPGVAIGLAWTPVGGEVLFIEASRMAGTGSLTLTGQLGDVMKESARAALSWLRMHAKAYSIDPDFFKNAEMHVHVPSGAIPKDGPSAGVTMTTAMASVLTGRPVRGDLAMTGEITLSGRVLPIGGVKEKVLAARRLGIHEVILPKGNAKNVNEDLTPELQKDLTVHLVSSIDEVLALALEPVSTDRPRHHKKEHKAPRQISVRA